MASRISVRQVSQTIRSNRLHLQPSRIQHYSSQPLFRAPSTARIRSFPHRQSIRSVQQTRNLSLWGSSSSKLESAADTSTSNLNSLEPSQFESLRTVKATDTSSDLSHSPNSFEPQFIENIQQAIVEPHGTEPAHVPLEQIPERLGYLYEVCGIDFGWGPSSLMQWVFEHIHIWGDLSWTSSIVVMSVGLRLFLVPFIIESAKQGGNMKLMAAAIKPIQAKIADAREKGEMMKVAEYTNEMKATASVYGVKFSRLFMPMLIQFPLGFAAWRNLRNCATLPVPGFVTESWLWNIDLTFSDTFYVVPAASALFIWLSLRVNANVSAATGSGGPAANQDAMKLLRTILPPISFFFMAFQPGAVQLYFACSSVMGYLTALVMSLDGVRKLLGLTTVGGVSTATPDGSEPPKVASFMRQRRNIIDVSSRTVSNESKAGEKAMNQNISAIDRGIGGFKSSFKGVFGGLVDKANAMGKSNNKEAEAAKVRGEIERARRERNAQIGGQQEKRR